MDHDDDFNMPTELPEHEPGNTAEAAQEFNRQVNQHLDILEHEVQMAENQDHKYSSQVRAAKLENVKVEHIIGILGATGVGKSALMNAIVGEEILLPTSGMRACTAVIIEVAYNTCTNHEFRAIVEFISREAWEDEIRKFFRLTGDSLEDLDDATSEAAITFAKLCAIYPDLNRTSLSTFTEDKFLSCPGLEVLGTSREIGVPSASEMNTELQNYVETNDNPEPPLVSRQGDPLDDSPAMVYWPLIRKVRLFVKAPALRTGLVLTDLPGVADTNPARAAIAINYLPKCASIWIVTEIKRAINDKIARDLGSESLKRQLRRDGILDRIVFVCSKADQMLVPEIKRKFQSDRNFKARMSKIENERENFVKRKKELKNDIAKLEKILESATARIKTLNYEDDAYAQLLEMAQKGTVVYPPVPYGLKRRSTTREPPPRKRPISSALVPYQSMRPHNDGDRPDANDPEVNQTSEAQNSSVVDVEQDFARPAMTSAAIQTKAAKIREQLRELRMKWRDRRSDMRTHKVDLESLEKSISSLLTQEWEYCYAARNEYVSKHLQSEFRQCIQDLKRAEIEADDLVDPNEEISDSAQGQTNVPIFFTSSQAFQMLQGRLEHESVSGRFTNIDQTGIPDLIRDCVNTGEKHITARRAIDENRIERLLASLRYWLNKGDDGNAVLPPGSQTIQKATEQLGKEITNTFERTFAEIASEMDRLSQTLDRGAQAGEKQALGIVRKWPASVHHQRYLAILRHGGVYPIPGGMINWIDELFTPMMRCIDNRWNRVLNEAIPTALMDAGEGCFRLIDDYVTTLGQVHEFSIATVLTQTGWTRQIERLKIELQQMCNEGHHTFFHDRIRASQVFREEFSSRLTSLFAEVIQDRGPGVCKRIQEKMEKKIRAMKSQIFGDAARKLILALRNSFNKSRDSISQSLRRAFDTIQQDCTNLFTKRARGHRRVSEIHRTRILREIRKIENLLSNQADVIGVGDTSSPNDNKDPDVLDTADTKEESSSRLARGISPTSYSTVSSSEFSERDGKDDDQWSVGSIYD